MRIAIAQMSTRAADFERTADRMVEYSRRAAADRVDLLVFPMATLTGPLPVDSPNQEGFLLDLAETFVNLSDRLACPSIVPLVTSFNGDLIPEAMFIHEGSLVPLKLGTYLKSLMPVQRGDGSSTSQDASAPDLPEVEIAGVRLGVAFTYDDLDAYDDFEYDADVILFLSGYGFSIDDPSSALGSALSEGRFLTDAEAANAGSHLHRNSRVGMPTPPRAGGHLLKSWTSVTTLRAGLPVRAPASRLLLQRGGGAVTGYFQARLLQPMHVRSRLSSLSALLHALCKRQTSRRKSSGKVQAVCEHRQDPRVRLLVAHSSITPLPGRATTVLAISSDSRD